MTKSHIPDWYQTLIEKKKQGLKLVEACAILGITKSGMIRRIKSHGLPSWSKIQTDDPPSDHHSPKHLHSGPTPSRVFAGEGGGASPPGGSSTDISPSLSHPNDRLPQAGGDNLQNLLPPSVAALVSLGPKLKDIPSWLGPFILEQIQNTTQGNLPAWTRPPILHPIQNEAIDAILYSNFQVIMIDGEKRLGKSWIGFIAWCEAQFNNAKYKRWFLYGATEQNASMILKSLKTDELIVDYCRPMLNGFGSALRVQSHVGGFMQVMASGSERQTSGTDADVIWVDESHSVLIENPKTIAMSAMVLRAQKNIKILYTMNREGEAYEYFKNEMLNNFPPDKIAYFSFNSQNCPHISIEQDKAVRTIVNASAGPDYAAQYLDNQYVREGGLYYPVGAVEKAYEPFEEPKLEQFDLLAAGIDWGDNHDTAITVLGFLEDEAYELETVYSQHPSASEIVRIITRLIREYPGIFFIWENSPLGSFARNEVRENYPNQRFIDSGFSKYKQNYIDNLYIWLVDENLHLKDGKLKRQLRSYCNDKKNDDGHDALCHVLYKAVAPRTRMKVSVTAVE